MLAYLIKSILCLLVLWGFYKIALEQTAAHNFKRFYLLGSMILALTLPLLTFSYTVEVEPQPVVAETYLDPTALTEVPAATLVDEPTNWLAISLGIIYAAGVLLFGFRFLRNLIRLRKKINSNEKVQAKSHINVLLAGKVIPHSFLRFIFLPKKEFKNNTIAPEILAHEQAHVAQKHSWDILAVEFLQAVFWFNPLLVLLKKSITLNHEFLADQAVLKNENSIENYTNLLFNYSGGAHHTALSSPINYSLTKKRILMLSKTRSVKKLATRLALFVPVLALCVYFFNQEIVAKPVLSKTNEQTIQGQWIDQETEFVEIQVFKRNDSLFARDFENEFWLEKSSDTQYNVHSKNSKFKKTTTLTINKEKDILLWGKSAFIPYSKSLRELFAGEWKAVNNNKVFSIKSAYGNTSWVIRDENGANNYYPVITGDGFYFTYDGKDTYFTIENGIMQSSTGDTFKKISNDKIFRSTPQHGNKQIIFQKEFSRYSDDSKTKILKKKSPTSQQLNDWKDASQYEVWVDGKRFKNSKLATKTPSDFSYVMVSKLEKNAKDYGKYYHHVSLMTPTYYKSHKEIELPPALKEIQEYLTLKLRVKDESVWVNGKSTSVENFVKTINEITKDWTKSDMMNYSIQVQTKNGVDKVISALSKEFKKTNLYKINPSRELIPPPPPPAPAAPASPTNRVPPPPPPAPVQPVNPVSGVPASAAAMPPPPAPPASPEEMIVLAKNNIYYNGNKVSESKAKTLFDNADQYDILFKKEKSYNLLLITDKD
ncbi:M56 family metallopeptidase [Leeuwenhoekiella polynyae]|uniref:Beta-lactamase regulating signal transducer with metallopeptidase domain n=1 Tax=Leeuwenhoekiella polynyae TaxID=1550906 RepID=A0A4Q0PFT2_9FLAO|nr:M56 family metallopeptidase [Leeuwenhoekiella polynyae]RXG25754.1 beta-lactamase regulating signal transducer with metallopeptidase domain [Leeuwenhoekiella polynyae]